MAADEQETLLKAWGVVYAERMRDVGPEARHRRTAQHPMAKSMQFAPGKKGRKITIALKDSGLARRMMLGRNAGIGHAVPRWAVDPIRCKESQPQVYGHHGRPVHPLVMRVEQAVKALEHTHFLRAQCLRVNYCTEGQHADKALEVNARMREVSHDFVGITVGQFRDHLLFGRIFVEGWMQHPVGVAA